MLYRGAGEADRDGIIALHIRGGKAAYSSILPPDYLHQIMPVEKEALWRQRLDGGVDRNKISVTVADSGSGLAGFCCFDFTQDGAFGTYLHNIYVSASHQRMGVASGLLVAGIGGFSAERLVAPLHLLVFARNSPARAFYDRLGGIIVETIARSREGSGPIPLCRYQWQSADALRLAALR